MKAKVRNVLIVNTFLLFMSWMSWAAPASLTYHGRILKADGTPLEYSSVSFIFQITNPAGSCVIYQEQITGYNMANSRGIFDIAIGGGTVQYPLGGAFSVLDAFNNTGSFTCGSCTAVGGIYSCSDGSGTYKPVTNHERLLRVQFYDGTGWKLISPDSIIRSVPFAGYAVSAQKLGTNIASDFVLKTGIPTCTAGTFLSWDGSVLTCAAIVGASGGTVTNVSSANSYLTIINNTSTPTLTLNVGTTSNTVASGNDPRLVNAIQGGSAASGDLSGTYPGPTVVALRGVGISSTTPTSGQFLKFNGTNWGAAAIATSDVSGLSASLSSYLTQSAFNGYVSSAGCSASQTMYWNSVSGNFQCQAINVGLAGDVTGSIGAAKVVALQNNPVDTTVPTNNQVLQWNGLKWIPATLPAGNPGTVTNVSGTAPISVSTGASTPVISISQATTSTNGYLSSTDWNIFNSKQAAGNYVTALTGDVTASGPGSVAATVAKLQGNTLTITTPASGNYVRYNGLAFVNSPLLASDLSGTLPASSLPAFSGDVTSSAGSTTLTLANAGTAGTYYKVTTDAKGRVISGAASLLATDIPSLDWSKITTGKPTTLSGYAITDAVKNAGGVGNISAGVDASKPGFPATGDLFVATDSQKIYRYSGSSWDLVSSAGGTGGTVTNVSSANADLSVATSTSTPVLTLNSGTGANQIVKLDGTAKLPAVDGSALTNLNASNLASGTVSTTVLPTIPLTKGGTGLTAAGTANQVLGMNNAGTAAEFKTITAGTGVSVTHGANSVTIATTGAPPTGAAGGDLSGTYPNPTLNTVTVAKGGTGLTTGTSGGILYFNSITTMASSAALTANGVLLGGGAGAPTATSAGAAYQPLRVPSVGGAPAFGAIDISQSAAVTGILPIANGGTGASSLAANRLIGTNGTGTVQQAVTCAVNQILSFDALGNYGCYAVSSIYSGFVNGGNSFGATSNLGNNDNFDLNIKTNNLTRMTVQAGGNVGIGTTTPAQKLSVVGMIESTSGGIKFPDGTIQTTSAVGGTNNTIVSGWPDAILCNWVTAPSTNDYLIMYIGQANAGGLRYYFYPDGGYYVYFNADGTYNGATANMSTTGTYACNVSISQKNSSGQSFNFVKGPAAQWLQAGTSAYYNAGNVGIGTTTPAAKLDVAGEVKFGNTSSTCNSSNEGQQRYNSTNKNMEFCDGTAWKTVGASSYLAGEVIAKTVYKNCTRSVVTAATSITFASFSVNKRVASSQLLMEGTLAGFGDYSGEMTPGWKLGAGTEALGQGVMYASSSNIHGKVYPTMAVLDGHTTTGAQTMVFRYYSASGSIGDKPFVVYNPNATDDNRLAQTCSVFVVTEIAQ